MILMAGDVVGDQVAEHRLGLMDISVRRNAYGRQVDSFEAPLEVEGLEEPFTAVFIRAPVVERVGSKVEVLASHDGLPSTGSTRSPSCVFVSSGDNQRPATARVVPGYGVAVSGHSKWSTIKRKKGANDAQRAKVWGKLLRFVEVAARDGGGNIDANPTLGTAVQKAKAASVPNDNIERAIKRGTGELQGDSFEEVSY
jgi:hypothetical protein